MNKGYCEFYADIVDKTADCPQCPAFCKELDDEGFSLTTECKDLKSYRHLHRKVNENA